MSNHLAKGVIDLILFQCGMIFNEYIRIRNEIISEDIEVTQDFINAYANNLETLIRKVESLFTHKEVTEAINSIAEEDQENLSKGVHLLKALYSDYKTLLKATDSSSEKKEAEKQSEDSVELTEKNPQTMSKMSKETASRIPWVPVMGEA